MPDSGPFPSWLLQALGGVANGQLPGLSVPNLSLPNPTQAVNGAGQAALDLARQAINPPPFQGPPAQNAPGLGGLPSLNIAPNARGVPGAVGQANNQLYTGLRGDPNPPQPNAPQPSQSPPAPSFASPSPSPTQAGGRPSGQITVQVQTPAGVFPVSIDPSQLAAQFPQLAQQIQVSPAPPQQGAAPPPAQPSPGGGGTGSNAGYASPFANMPASNLGFSQMGGAPPVAPPMQPQATPNASPFGGGAQQIPNAQASAFPAQPTPLASPLGGASPLGQQLGQAAASTGATPNQTYEAELIAAMINGQQVADSSGKVIADFTTLPVGARQAILYGLMQSSSAVQSSGGQAQQQAPPAPSFGAPPSGLLPPAQSPFPQQLQQPQPVAPSAQQPQFTAPAQPGGAPGFVNPTPTGLLPSPQQATGTNLPFTPTSSAIQPFSPTGTSSSSSTTSATAAATANQIAQQLALTHPQLYQQTQGFQNFFATPASQSGFANVPGYGILPVQALMSSKGSILAGPFLAAHLDSLARKGQIPPAQDLVGGAPAQAGTFPGAGAVPNGLPAFPGGAAARPPASNIPQFSPLG